MVGVECLRVEGGGEREVGVGPQGGLVREEGWVIVGGGCLSGRKIGREMGGGEILWLQRFYR